MNKIIWIITFLVLCSFVFGGDIQSLGLFEQNKCINLKQTCGNCTFVNFTSITFPDGDTAILDINSTKRGTTYNYTFCNTSQIGKHTIDGKGDLKGDGVICEKCIFSYDFTITPDGTDPSTAQGMMYSFVLVILIILLSFSMIGAVKINGKNELDMGGLVQVNINKYIKIGLFFLSYLLLIFISFVTWQISLNFLFLTIASMIFKFVFDMLLIFLTPFFLGFMALLIIKTVLDWKLHKLSEIGLKPYKGDKW